MQQHDLIQEFDIEQLEQRVEFGVCGGGDGGGGGDRDPGDAACAADPSSCMMR